ncbi:MAG: AAA family ATPase [Gammaproteobacteria bacterium]|nr:AAA family ATPase [Gammaproteobacteria bacterium]
MAQVFVSYASEDRSRVAPLVAAIEQAGWSVWWDRKIDGGAAWEREIERELDESRCVVVVWSAVSIESDWVRTEAGEGQERGVLLPIAIDDVRPPLAFRRTQTLELIGTDPDTAVVLAALERLVPKRIEKSRDVSPYVGRASELERLIAMAKNARAGNGLTVLISGEAGVGKTRLVEEVALRARTDGVLVLSGRCQDLEAPPAYHPFIEQIELALRIVAPERLRRALGDNAPEIAKLMPELRTHFADIVEPVQLSPEHERRYLLNGVAEFSERAARVQPLMLVYEDLQWADESTCTLFQHLAQWLREAAVLLVGTYRSTELKPASPLAGMLPDLLRQRLAEDILLQRLDKAGVGELIGGRAGKSPPGELVDLVFSETEGNPFFVEEVYRHLTETGKLLDEHGDFRSMVEISDTEVPRSLLLVIEQRLQRVSEMCRKALTTAAVIGRDFQFEVLAAASELGDDELLDAIEEAESATLVNDVSREREARYQFEHEQIRQTLLNGLSFVRRQRTHLRIADAIETVDAQRAREIGYHLYRAGASADRERTAGFLADAGNRALSSSGFEDALKQFDMTLEVLDADDGVSRARIHRLRSRALRGAARIDDALAALANGMAHTDDTEALDDLLSDRGWLFVDLYRGQEAERDFELLLAHAEASGDSEKILNANDGLSRAHYVLSLDTPGYADIARNSTEKVIEIAREHGDRERLARALIHSTWFSDYDEKYLPVGLANAKEALAIAEALGDEELRLSAGQRMMRFRIYDPGIETVDSDVLAERLQKMRDPVRLNDLYFWMMWTRLVRCEFGKCVETCDAGIKTAASIGVPPVQYPTIKSFALSELGRFDAAFASLDEEVSDAEHRFGAAFQRHGTLLLLSELGAVDRVLDAAPALVRELVALNRPHFVRRVMSAVARLLMVRNDSAVRDVLDAASADAGFEPPRVALALRALADGDTHRARELAQHVLAASQATESPRGEADAHQIGVLVALAEERWEDAVAASGRALTIVHESRNARWRLLSQRARALQALGDDASARSDVEESAALVRELSESIGQMELRDCFLAIPDAVRVLAAVS